MLHQVLLAVLEEPINNIKYISIKLLRTQVRAVPTLICFLPPFTRLEFLYYYKHLEIPIIIVVYCLRHSF